MENICASEGTEGVHAKYMCVRRHRGSACKIYVRKKAPRVRMQNICASEGTEGSHAKYMCVRRNRGSACKIYVRQKTPGIHMQNICESEGTWGPHAEYMDMCYISKAQANFTILILLVCTQYLAPLLNNKAIINYIFFSFKRT